MSYGSNTFGTSGTLHSWDQGFYHSLGVKQDTVLFTTGSDLYGLQNKDLSFSNSGLTLLGSGTSTARLNASGTTRFSGGCPFAMTFQIRTTNISTGTLVSYFTASGGTQTQWEISQNSGSILYSRRVTGVSGAEMICGLPNGAASNRDYIVHYSCRFNYASRSLNEAEIHELTILDQATQTYTGSMCYSPITIMSATVSTGYIMQVHARGNIAGFTGVMRMFRYSSGAFNSRTELDCDYGTGRSVRSSNYPRITPKPLIDFAGSTRNYFEGTALQQAGYNLNSSQRYRLCAPLVNKVLITSSINPTLFTGTFYHSLPGNTGWYVPLQFAAYVKLPPGQVNRGECSLNITKPTSGTLRIKFISSNVPLGHTGFRMKQSQPITVTGLTTSSWQSSNLELVRNDSTDPELRDTTWLMIAFSGSQSTMNFTPNAWCVMPGFYPGGNGDFDLG